MPMHAMIKVTAGPSEGKEAICAAGQVLEVGRSSRCGLVVADMRMSSLHFSLEYRGEDCRLRDLGSRNGVFVNGHRVETAVVSPDDVIAAGDSRFSLTLTSQAPEAINRSAIAPEAMNTPQPTDTAEMPAGGVYRQLAVPTGVTRYEPIRKQPLAPVSLIKGLATKLPVYVVANPPRMEQAIETIGSAQYLFDWLPEPAQRAASPIVFPLMKSPFKDLDGYGLLNAAWGKDSLFCVASQREPGKVLRHLRELARGRERADLEPLPGAASGFYVPRVLEQMLSVGEPATAQFILSELDALVVECPKAKGWALFAHGDFAAVLAECGFEEVESAEPHSEPV